jgi:hypothetical protein
MLTDPTDVPVVAIPFQLPHARYNSRLGLALHMPPIKAPVIPIANSHATVPIAVSAEIDR